MRSILKLSVLVVAVLSVPAFAQPDRSNRADRKITGEAYRPHISSGYRSETYRPYVRQYPAQTFAPATVVAAPAPVPAPAVAAVPQNGTGTYRSFSYDPAPAPTCVAPVTQNGSRTYRSFSYEPAPVPTYVAPAPTYSVPAPTYLNAPVTQPSGQQKWRADRKTSGAAYR